VITFYGEKKEKKREREREKYDKKITGIIL
jgi:hypothetical protein